MAMSDLATQLVEQAKEYQGKSQGEQEYLLAMALADIQSEGTVPDLGPRDFWIRARDDLVRQILHQRVAVQGVAGVAAQQVAMWADSGDFSSVRFQIALAILTAMVTDAVLNAAGGGGSDENNQST